MNVTSTATAVSVVVCAYTLDRWEEIKKAIISIEDQSSPASEVLLIIDHNDELFELAEREFRDIRVLRNVHQRGLSGARNTGWREATGDVVAFLDDDAVAHKLWLEQLVAPYEDPRVVGVGGHVEPEWGDGRPESFPEEFLWVVGCSYRGMPEHRSEVRNMIGANMSLRRSSLARTSGFDSDLGRVGTRPVGCEETELCLRLAQEIPGSQIIYEPTARVRHLVPGTRGTWSYFRSRCYAEGLSKAHVRRISAATDALDTEVAYVRRTLPTGVLRAIGDSARSRNPTVALQAAGIAVGLGCTAAGYAVGSLRRSVPTSDTGEGAASDSTNSSISQETISQETISKKTMQGTK